MILSSEIRSSSQEREKGGSVGSLHFPEHMPIGLSDAFLYIFATNYQRSCAPFLMPNIYVGLIPENVLPNIEQENEQKVV